jgi:hypothetical protein
VTIHEYLIEAIQDDARRAGERDRLLLEARQAHRERRQRPIASAQARRRVETGKLLMSDNVTPHEVIRARAGDEAFAPGGWVGLIANSPQLAKLALGEALAAGAFLLRRRSYGRLTSRWPSRCRGLAADAGRRQAAPAARRRVRAFPRSRHLEERLTSSR